MVQIVDWREDIPWQAMIRSWSRSAYGFALNCRKRPRVVGFTYIDPQAGFSAQGWQDDASNLDQSSRTIIRLPVPGVPWTCLSQEEIHRHGLESPPFWVVEFYGPQPPAGTLWGSCATIRN